MTGYRGGGGTLKSKKGAEPNVGINKKTLKAYYISGLKKQFFPFHFITESFSAHLIIQWLNQNTLIALTVRPCGKIIKFPWFWAIQLHDAKRGQKGKKNHSPCAVLVIYKAKENQFNTSLLQCEFLESLSWKVQSHQSGTMKMKVDVCLDQFYHENNGITLGTRFKAFKALGKTHSVTYIQK